jgi:hypothetical protein
VEDGSSLLLAPQKQQSVCTKAPSGQAGVFKAWCHDKRRCHDKCLPHPT